MSEGVRKTDAKVDQTLQRSSPFPLLPYSLVRSPPNISIDFSTCSREASHPSHPCVSQLSIFFRSPLNIPPTIGQPRFAPSGRRIRVRSPFPRSGSETYVYEASFTVTARDISNPKLNTLDLETKNATRNGKRTRASEIEFIPRRPQPS